MSNKKGQALVEFIIIMPVFILIIMAIIDYARIINTKASLESTIEQVIDDPEYKLSDDISLNEVTTNGEISYYLRKNITIYSPFLSAVLESPYPVEIKRVIYEK